MPPSPPARFLSAARRNTAFRRVLGTAGGKQYVAMALRPGESIGRERHDTTQEFWIVSGEARVDLEGDRFIPWWLSPGNYLDVEAGREHNVSNVGEGTLRLLTRYGRALHRAGEVQVRKPNPREPRLGSGGRFKALTSKLAKRGVRDPKALAASIGRKKYGPAKMARMAAAGRKRARSR